MKKQETYRKLTERDLEILGIKETASKQTSDSYDHYREFVKKFYPKEAALAEVIVSSEYNDSTYDNSIQMVVVYNEHGDELVPNKSTARECRSEMTDLCLPRGEYDSSEPKESFFVQLSPKFPDLYVKEAVTSE